MHDYYDEASWKELRDVGVPSVNRSGHWQGHSRLRNLATGELTDVETTMFRVKTPQGDKPTCLAILHRTPDSGDRLRRH